MQARAIAGSLVQRIAGGCLGCAGAAARERVLHLCEAGRCTCVQTISKTANDQIVPQISAGIFATKKARRRQEMEARDEGKPARGAVSARGAC
jgi:hypothetical protein